MKIEFVDIQNFRKLKSCRVELSAKETVFVGANNSGKTSAMDALMIFLTTGNIQSTDFTLTNWKRINKIADDWLKDSNNLNLNPEIWHPNVPSLDIWLNVENNEIHYVSHLIPTLGWRGGRLGVRLIFEPKNQAELYKSYKAAFEAARNTTKSRKQKNSLKLWPQSMRDFLEKELHRQFETKLYILDPAKSSEATPQPLLENSEPLDGKPLKGLFKIEIINAQRGFSDPNSTNKDRRLSSQLRSYFENHLNPTELPDTNDLDALEAIDAAKTAFDEKIRKSFNASIGELQDMNYPGISDPRIHISSKVTSLDVLNHDAVVQFNVFKEGSMLDDASLYLPEKYNGLGYQNLISMIFNLIRFRDEWMRIGKVGRRKEIEDDFIEPLQIILIEEPEAHLHAQVQQVFIKKAYSVLRNHPDLKDNSQFTTQLIISTHSSHVAHEIDFGCLRYFKRTPATNVSDIPSANVVNLSNTFGNNSDTARFATRYLKTTHCDLFFADAAIIVEGPAERMLVPHFICSKFPELDRSFISLLEIGGSHAHRLRPLIETLGLLTLVITDLDSIEEDSAEKALPEKGKEFRTGNDTIKSWIPGKSLLDDVLNAKSKDKIKNKHIRVAYQYEVNISYTGKKVTAIPYTFEDALALSNISFFKKRTSDTGLIGKIANAVNEASITEALQKMFEALGKGSKKAEMALELLYTTEPSELEPPQYIQEGLEWLREQLKCKHNDYILEAKNG